MREKLLDNEETIEEDCEKPKDIWQYRLNKART
jgi:hypothetical protein